MPVAPVVPHAANAAISAGGQDSANELRKKIWESGSGTGCAPYVVLEKISGERWSAVSRVGHSLWGKRTPLKGGPLDFGFLPTPPKTGQPTPERETGSSFWLGSLTCRYDGWPRDLPAVHALPRLPRRSDGTGALACAASVPW